MSKCWVFIVLPIVFSFPARAEPTYSLAGQVVDALDGKPITGASVSVFGQIQSVHTNEQGKYVLDLPEGTWRLKIEHPAYVPSELANQRIPTQGLEGLARIFPLKFPEDFVPNQHTLRGLGTGTGDRYVGPVPLFDNSLLYAAVPQTMPTTIRVGRFAGDGNRCDTYLKTDVIDFEEYVEGVVYGEVLVFRGVSGGTTAAMETWKAFAVAARSYGLYYILTSKPGDRYDINDTACNQRYVDSRDPSIRSAVEATAGQILVSAANPDMIDKYFYAASCAHCGTQPAYGTSLIPDPTSVRACVNTWCGHTTCAGHDYNSACGLSGRCLVWGICQWGSIERSSAGDSYENILAHYQPNCVVRDFHGGPPTPCALIEPYDTFLIEEDHKCFSKFGPVNYWHIDAGGSNGQCVWTYTTDKSAPENYAYWNLHFTQAGTYELSTYISATFGKSKKARYLVLHNGQQAEIVRDQTEFQDSFMNLGEFYFAAGGQQRVQLNDNTGEAYTGTDGTTIVFDALKIVPLRITTEETASQDAGDTQDNDPNAGAQGCGCMFVADPFATNLFGWFGLLLVLRRLKKT